MDDAKEDINGDGDAVLSPNGGGSAGASKNKKKKNKRQNSKKNLGADMDQAGQEDASNNETKDGEDTPAAEPAESNGHPAEDSADAPLPPTQAHNKGLPQWPANGDSVESPRSKERGQEVVQVRNENRRLTTELNRLSNEISQLQSKVETSGVDMEQSLIEAIADKEKAEKALERLTAELSIVNRRYQNVIVERDEGIAVISDLRRDLGATRQELESVSGTTQRNKAQATLQSLQDENAQLKQTLFFTIALQMKNEKLRSGKPVSMDVQSLWETYCQEETAKGARKASDGSEVGKGTDMSAWIFKQVQDCA